MEHIVVYTIIGLIVAGWFAMCFDCQDSAKEALIMAIGLPAMVVSTVAVTIYIFHSFSVVFGN